jgi:phage shock protein PspC (stress-responsive transcriptional regulator)
MEKVVTINLNGNAFQLEEPGYAALRSYLERAQAGLESNPDRAEILADIEQSIAEKCARYLNERKTVVTAPEVEAILAEMGPVETGDAQSAAGSQAGEQPRTDAPKRLYQIREGAMLTGVCKGIAAYLNIDVTFVRIAFVILAFATFGAAALIYVVLAFIIPYADTTEEHAAAYGFTATAQGLIEQAKRHSESFRARQEWRRGWHWQQRAWQRHWRRHERRTRQQARAGASIPPVPPVPPMPPMNYATHAVLGVTTPIFAIVHAAVFVAWAYALLSMLTTGTIFGWKLPVDIPVWASILILVVLYGMVTAPLKALRFIGYEHQYAPHHASFGALHGIIWLGATVLLAWLAYKHIPEAHTLIDNLPNSWHHAGPFNVESFMHDLQLDRLIARQ